METINGERIFLYCLYKPCTTMILSKQLTTSFNDFATKESKESEASMPTEKEKN